MERGRPSAYKAEYAQVAKEMCKLGATDADLADAFDVAIATITNWKNTRPNFLAALKGGKHEVDNLVERSLLNRALGYSFDAVKIFCHDGEIIKVPYREHIPPDTTACIFWLKNRRPQEWRDKHDLNVNGRVNVNHSLVPSDIAALAAGDLDELQRKYSETLDLVAEVQQIPAASDDRTREEPA
jgi:hypothetical protein